ncbi:hypothetical protein BDA96_04G080300 [Sorghum bicolor]|uniref:Uncharacterized protein n=2 Tax=Sorghum bicolor TaxID=4558 RepID=A0A194YN92_SORBI|nr:hypothetical protein BDA96_04G080300 [Sorghum bicolor]KXG29672.1 hypothetical protein SORBI_3004G073700 [Sorghum bicolor]
MEFIVEMWMYAQPAMRDLLAKATGTLRKYAETTTRTMTAHYRQFARFQFQYCNFTLY